MRRPRFKGDLMRIVSKRKLVVGLLAMMIIGASCGNNDTSSSSTTSDAKTNTSTTAATNPAPYAEPGPYAVGFTELKLPDGRRAVVWYPTTKGDTKGHEQEQIDLAGFLNPELQAKVPAEDRVLYPADAYRDAPLRPEKGGYPVVLFSHGYAGYPEQSVSLTTHFASWGYVVPAPDHVERSLDGLLGTAAQGVTKSTDPEVLSATLDLVEAESKNPDSILHDAVDPDRVAVTGHSAGAAAAYRTAGDDPRIDGWISYSVGFQSKDGAESSKPTPPEKPGMVQYGTKDGIIDPAASEEVFAEMNSPKYLVKITGAGHLVFSDLCLIGAEKGGIVGIAKALELPIPDSLLKLGSDGCGPDYPPVEDAFPAIDQTSVSFLRWVFGQDKEPVGLSTEAIAGLGGDVTVTKG